MIEHTNFKEVRLNTFIIMFATHVDRSRVEDGRPWFFNSYVFVINGFDGLVPPSMMKFDKEALWVQFHNMPLIGMNQACGEKLGRS